MSKELDEALKNIKIRCHSKVVWYDPIDFDLEIVDQALSKAQEQEKVLEIIMEKGFDESIRDSNSYATWVEYKTEQFAEAIKKHPTILNWDVFDKIIYTEQEFKSLKEYLNKYKERSEVK